MTVRDIINKLNLEKHPEGGFFFETYRSDINISEKCLPDKYSVCRNASTAIYFLITENDFSHFHRVSTDEIFHFYLGSPAILTEIDEEGKLTERILGNDIIHGERPQITIKAGNWQSLRCKEKGFTLIGATVAPGFDFSDFEIGKREFLLEKFPQHSKAIKELTK